MILKKDHNLYSYIMIQSKMCVTQNERCIYALRKISAFIILDALFRILLKLLCSELVLKIGLVIF